MVSGDIFFGGLIMPIRTLVLIIIIALTICGCEKSPKSLAEEVCRMRIMSDYKQGNIDNIKIIDASLEDTTLSYKKYRARGNATISMITDSEITYRDNNESIHLPKGTKVKVQVDMKLSFMVGCNGHIETDIFDYENEKFAPY